MGWVTWHAAMAGALYGEEGFYRRGERPAAHFRTSVHASSRYAAAFARLLTEVDASLGRPSRVDLVDVGAGCGELVVQILAAVDPELAARIRPTAVEVAPRPGRLPRELVWRAEPPDEITGLVIANEWLDNVPLDVVELTAQGPRVVLVDPATGIERTGPAPAEPDAQWLARWWPLREPGDRAEVGRTRCAAWASVVGRLRRGVAIAVDYAHARRDRPAWGTLTGYRDGHVVPPVPDGSCDITAHVALDACAGSGERAGATTTLLTGQRSALRALGVTGARPDVDLARRDPRAYVAALCAAGEDAELIDPSGLGGFGWLVQAVDTPLPASLAGLASGRIQP
ncbi:MAG TPA: SAM-dependent methyltransferase [Actinomadura sp.]|nr:SAM-dependent methyltransferase [Actinomadura sp.]